MKSRNLVLDMKDLKCLEISMCKILSRQLNVMSLKSGGKFWARHVNTGVISNIDDI